MKKRRKPSKAGRWFLEPIGKKDEEGAKSPATMRKFCIFDIESKDGDSQKAGFTRPFMVGFYDPDEPEFAERYSEFHNEPHLAKRHWRRRHLQPGGCIDKLMTKFLQAKYAGRILYAHFGGNFDHLFLPAWLVMHQDEYGFEIIPVQSSIQVLRVWRKPENPEDEIKEEWDFLDTHKLLPMALSKACKAFRVPNKLDMDLHRHEDSAEWAPYLRRDCEALAQVMRSMYSMVHDRLGGEMGITTPSTSMKLFRRRFMGAHGVSEKIPRFAHWRDCMGAKLDFDAPGACPGCAHDWIRRGYYGGRTEIFRLFGTLLKYFDINSSYVAAMREEMPIGARDDSHRHIDRVGDAIQWERHRSDLNPDANWTGFAEVTVFIPESCPIPPLPHKNRESGKLQFPVGQLYGVWSLEELALLNDPLVQGRIVHTHSVIYYKLAPCFGPMVGELWQFRNTKNPDYDPGLSELAKLLGNGLYGKFAMRQERQTMVFAKSVDPEQCFLCGQPTVGGTSLCLNCQGSKPASETDPDCPVWYQAKRTDAPYIIPHISAHITARARVRLWQFMKTALRTQTGERNASGFREGDVAFVGDRAHLVLQSEVFDVRVELVLRDLDAELDPNRLGDVAWSGTPNQKLGQGGTVYYTDTDSVVTDATLPATQCVCGHVRMKHQGAGADGACTEEGCKCKRLLVHIWGTGSMLGEMKDEHPGELLNYLGLQPKAYLIERTKHNKAWADVQPLRFWFDDCTVKKVAWSEREFTDCSSKNERCALSRPAVRRLIQLISSRVTMSEVCSGKRDPEISRRIAEAEQEAALVHAQADAPFGVYAKEEFYPASKLDPIVSKYFAKVTLKGFPPGMRTKGNLEKLRGGKIDWEEIKKGNSGITGPGQTLEWSQLEKVRTLARRGFTEPPRMREKCCDCVWDGRALVVKCVQCAAGKGPIAVSKSFKSLYDKRVVIEDGSGRTRGVAVYEPIGGFQEVDSDFMKVAE